MNIKTKKQSLELILKRLDEDKLGAMVVGENCIYQNEDKTRTCIVGALFSQEQLDYIKEHDLNDRDISDLFVYIGEKNIIAVTGMTEEELGDLQFEHDTAYVLGVTKEKKKQLRQYIVKKLKECK